MASPSTTARTMSPKPCSVIELRQYTLHPGQRETLIALFEREFIETQEAVGLQVLGIFRDLDAEDRFVWWRGFADMPARAAGLAAFYGGPAWQAHRNAANATMVDSDDVLLLRPLTAWPTTGTTRSNWHAVVCPLATPPDAALVDALRASGDCWLETEPAENNFPRLPVRGGETVVVGLSRAPLTLPALLAERLAGAVQHLHLAPTGRSRRA